jgi:hypothetical protein
MIPPTAILGAISTCEGFLKEIYSILKEVKNCPQDIGRIVENFSLSQLMLPRFFAFFKTHMTNIREEIATEIATITNSLNGKLQYLVSKLKAMRDGRTWRRLTWYWAKDDLSEAEKELALWMMKIHALAQCFPPIMRNDLYNEFVSADFQSTNSPLTAFLTGLAMRKKLEEDENRRLEDFSLRGKAPVYPAEVVHFDCDKWIVPLRYTRKKEEQDRIELDIARLVSLLTDTGANRMYLPKASHYSCNTFESNGETFTESFAIHYEIPANLTSIDSLKLAIKSTIDYVSSWCDIEVYDTS